MNLEEGEIICPECNGKGRNPSPKLDSLGEEYGACYKCYGFGKLTWTENICGKKNLSGMVYAPYLPIMITSSYLPTIQTLDQLKNYAKIIGYEKEHDDVDKYKEELFKCLKS